MSTDLDLLRCSFHIWINNSSHVLLSCFVTKELRLVKPAARLYSKQILKIIDECKPARRKLSGNSDGTHVYLSRLTADRIIDLGQN